MKNNGQDEPIPPEPEENTHFTCKFCGDTYGEDRFLQEHIKSVHEQRQQYECTLCDAILLGKDDFIFLIQSALKSFQDKKSHFL